MFDRFAGRNATSPVYDSRPVWVGRGGMGCVVDERRETQCGWRTKINWTQTAHRKRHKHAQVHIGTVLIHTHTQTVVRLQVEH